MFLKMKTLTQKTKSSQLSPTDFNPRFAHDVLLLLAEAAYAPGLKPGDRQIPPNYTLVGKITMNQTKALSMTRRNQSDQKLLRVLLEDGNFFGWVMKNVEDGIVAVTFRGTETANDWLNNLAFSKCSYGLVEDYGEVHSGFYAYYIGIRDSLLRLLNPTLLGSCKRLILTGHSLGSALDELAGPDLLHNVLNPNVTPEVQNFAGPRTGDLDFAGRFDVEINKCFRIANIWDLVPHVPPGLLGFTHVGNEVLVDGGFTDFVDAHKLETSYETGLSKLVQNPQMKAISIAARDFPNAVVVGRSP